MYKGCVKIINVVFRQISYRLIIIIIKIIVKKTKKTYNLFGFFDTYIIYA